MTLDYINQYSEEKIHVSAILIELCVKLTQNFDFIYDIYIYYVLIDIHT